MTDSPIKVLLVDDHAVVRAGYKRYLELDTKIEVVGEAEHGEQAYELLATLTADVIVMDLSMPGRGGIESIRHILQRYPEQRILVFTMHENPALAAQALRAGAKGYLTKSVSPDLIVDAIHQIMQGGQPIDTDLAAAIKQSELESAPYLQLAPREFEIFRLLANGQSVDEIGQRLHLGLKTVSNYQTSIRQKLGVTTAIELHQYARQYGLA
ncbi:MAG: Response regulator containing a CheY-like receiver domain and an DNA-binding domain [Pseudomonadota bacterium]|jgi:DNA-binding NarL/FixJ family response regulator